MKTRAEAHMRQQQLFFDSLCAAFTIPEIEELVKASKLERVKVERVSDRHWSAARPIQLGPLRGPSRG